MLTGGAGVDRFWGSASDWDGDRITDYQYGETIALVFASLSLDDYRLRFNGTDTFLDYDYDGTPGFDGSIILSGKVNGTIALMPFFSGGATYAGLTVTQTNAIYGDQGDNTIIDNSIVDTVINGLRGNDVINSGNGNDIIYGGAGNDSLLGNFGNDTLLGGTVTMCLAASSMSMS